MLSSGKPSAPHLDFLLRHSVKMLNIYYHLVTNQRHPPPTSSHSGSSSSGSSKPPKSELFAREQPAASLQALGYFAGDYVYMKLYNILRGANDSYKVSQATDSRIQSEQPPLSRWWRRNGKSCAARALRFASNPALSIQHSALDGAGDGVPSFGCTYSAMHRFICNTFYRCRSNGNGNEL